MSIHNIPSKAESTFLKTFFSYMTAPPSRLRFFGTIVLLCAGCSGFGDVGKQYRVDSGVDPRKQDEDVRFRTTYYFRVFDACEELDEESRINNEYETVGRAFTKRKKGKYRLLSDSLYRFRMTGKASAWFQKVHFESGTLRAEQIDPFGATIDYDEESGKFRVQSARANQEIQQRNDIYTEIKRLHNLKTDFKADSPEADQKIQELILEQLQLLSVQDQQKAASMLLTLWEVRQSVKDAISASETALENDSAKTVLSGMKSNAILSPATPNVDILSKMEDQQKKSVQDFILALEGSEGFIAKLDAVIVSVQKEVSRKRQAFEQAQVQYEQAKVQYDQAAALHKAAIAIQETQKEISKLEDENKKIPQDLQDKLTSNEKFLSEAHKNLDEAKSDYISKNDNFKNMENNQEKAKKDLIASQYKVDQLQDSRRQIILQTKRLWRLAETQIGPSRTSGDRTAVSSSPYGSLTCPDGTHSRRGFQVLGPEGFRSFDQDERLVMAMSSDAKPLISLIQQVSERQFSSAADASARTKLATQERSRLKVIERELDVIESDLVADKGAVNELTPEVILQRVLDQYDASDESNTHLGKTITKVEDVIGKELDVRLEKEGEK